ncbi:MAG: hypothetical protein R2690_02145 [Acidimicrobiales bacterium]
MRRLLAGCALAATLIVALLDLAVVPGRAAVDAAPITADPCAVVDSCGLGELAARWASGSGSLRAVERRAPGRLSLRPRQALARPRCPGT